MKSTFIADLQEGRPVQELFLVRSREVRTSAKGATWLQLVLVDKTGSIDAKLWKSAGEDARFEEVARMAEPQHVIRVQGRTKTYQGKLEISIERLSPAGESEYNRSDFVAATQANVDELFARLEEEVARMQDPWLRKLSQSFLEDPEIGAKLRRAPAAKSMHHAYVGGLLEHVVSLCGLARFTAQHYPEVNYDLLLTGILLHDIGKTEELSSEFAIDYSNEGRLLGHIPIGAAMVREKIAAIPGFPPRLAMLVEHMILSHHGTREFGSPVEPRFREAVLLHHLDNMDSKMAAAREILAATGGEEFWTGRSYALGQNLLRAEAFLEDAAGAGGEKSAGKKPLAAAKGR